ncbi:DNA-binding response regulator [Oxalicibacterium solurbis]|uniref:DNA-binding response regulator n=2 Tax=Oxalicibacterium solurbis TaxID=69280 RepID=A0A8J3B475_9BURK|nr:response regulator transcription factor [Oxalicibacterium solurbis]GGI54788.1 DNA-binding response regulator [Oxalicibacterium solurbis]
MVEDDASFRESVCAAMVAAPDMAIDAVAASVAEGMTLLNGDPADVLVVDLGLPDGSGIQLIREARQQWPQCEVIVATLFGDEDKVLSAIEAGASGYLLKDALPLSLVDEIRNVCAGGSPVSPMIARQLLRRLRSIPVVSNAGDADREPLSVREIQVLERMALGYTMAETAEHLGIAVTTVNTFVRRIYTKLGVCSKVEAIDAGYRRGLLHRN